MKFEFKRTPVELNIYGDVFSINMPSDEQVMSVSEAIDGLNKKGDTAGILLARRQFLADLGVPMEVLKKMEAQHVTDLFGGLLGEVGGTKKKSASDG